jgi:hypothetical protein
VIKGIIRFTPPTVIYFFFPFEMSKLEELQKSVPIDFWNKLTDEDKSSLEELINSIQKSSKKQMSNASKLATDLVKINNFVMSPPEATREAKAICCGLFFYNSSMLINTKQMKIILGRCKSGINTMLQKLGYGSSKVGLKKNILKFLPSLENYPDVARQWTSRSTIMPQIMPHQKFIGQREEIDQSEESKQKGTTKQKHLKNFSHQITPAQYQRQIQQYQYQQLQLQMQQQMQQRILPSQQIIVPQYMTHVYKQPQMQVTAPAMPVQEQVTPITIPMVKQADALTEVVRPNYLPISMTTHISQSFRFFIPKTAIDREMIFTGPPSSPG